MLPSKTLSAAPDIKILSSSEISTSKTPPFISTTTFFPTKFCLFAAITDAHAPVPHASVIPTPLSNVIIEILSSELIFTTDIFTPSGKTSPCNIFFASLSII